MLKIIKVWPEDPETKNYGGFKAIKLSDGSFAWANKTDPCTIGNVWVGNTWKTCSAFDPLYKYIAGKMDQSDSGAGRGVILQTDKCKYNHQKLPQFAEEFNYWGGDMERGLPPQVIEMMTKLQKRVLRNLRELPVCGYSNRPVEVSIISQLMQHETIVPTLHCKYCWG